ncbi:MAG: DM13 domain-containing protein [Pseudomonadota bacterium]|nr:MAG: DM13 domain-containing protein [Pseudomonadota bacterium]
MKKILVLLFSHLVAAAAGFAIGIYALPILTAPPAPTASEVRQAADTASFTGEFRRDLEDSDALHWGEGTVYVGPRSISLQGSIAPGPNYKLYLSPEFVETEKDFARLRSRMAQVGDVNTFENFIVTVPDSIDTSAFNTVIVWCEAFEQFITSAQYQ